MNPSRAKRGGPGFLVLDPRTKFVIVLIISLSVISGRISGPAVYPRMVLSAVPFFLLISGQKIKAASFYFLCLVAGYLMEAFFVYGTEGIVSILSTILSGLITRFFPCVAMGYYLMATTKVCEVIAALEKIRSPRFIIIPLAVMFRFFPTVREESGSISDAMRMRGIGLGSMGKNPVNLLEYRLVPLLISLVKIGEELTVSALTRGLGSPGPRTNIHPVRLRPADFIIGLVVLTAAVLYSVL